MAKNMLPKPAKKALVVDVAIGKKPVSKVPKAPMDKKAKIDAMFGKMKPIKG